MLIEILYSEHFIINYILWSDWVCVANFTSLSVINLTWLNFSVPYEACLIPADESETK